MPGITNHFDLPYALALDNQKNYPADVSRPLAEQLDTSLYDLARDTGWTRWSESTGLITAYDSHATTNLWYRRQGSRIYLHGIVCRLGSSMAAGSEQNLGKLPFALSLPLDKHFPAISWVSGGSTPLSPDSYGFIRSDGTVIINPLRNSTGIRFAVDALAAE